MTNLCLGCQNLKFICREVSMWNLFQFIMPTTKPDVKIFGKQFSGYNNLSLYYTKYYLIDSLHLFPRLKQVYSVLR
jgi:hypothetical protein